MDPRTPFPVLCDRCRAEGRAGEAEFETLAGLGDLLDFEPVPRRVARADGWTPENHRAYVAALAVTGSERQACAVVGRAAFGISQLRKCAGSESFFAACDAALEIWRERERVRRSDNLLAAAHGEAARIHGRPPLAWSGAASRRLPSDPEPPSEAPPDPAGEEQRKLELLEAIVGKLAIKLKQERDARLEGRIADADFYLRQFTCLEVALDLISGDGWRALADFRSRGYSLLHIAQTPMSKLVDAVRRQHWEEAGDPPRPEHPPRHLLEEKGDFDVEPLECGRTDDPRDLDEQQRAFDERHVRDAQAQVEWEAEARRDYERRRAGDADS
ncbi:MAG TPA: hypothetical protein VF619_02725 [Allosphingosinicella sp.]